MRGLIFGFVLVASLVVACSLDAQTPNATIVGMVTDQTGAVVPGVAVTARHVATNRKWSAETDAGGGYRLVELPLGEYEFYAERAGFAPFLRKGIVLQVNDYITADVVLQPAAVAERVEVVAEVGRVETQASSIRYVMEERRISDLPLLNRTPLDLVLLNPGTNSFSYTGFNINGARANTHNFTFNGADNNNLNSTVGPGGVPLTGIVQPNSDTVQEFSLISSVASAEFGRGTGAAINVVTKSGSNSFHGNLREFLRNPALNANDFFANQSGLGKEAFSLHQFGGQLGGPLWLPKIYSGRDRTFFFVDYEGLRRSSRSARFFDSFTPAMRAGNLAGSAAAERLYPGGQVPTSAISPIARKYMDLLPLPNQPNNQFGFLSPSRSSNSQVTAKVDQTVRGRNNLSGTFSYILTDTFAAQLFPGVPTPTLKQELQNLVVADTHTFTPSVVNVFRFARSDGRRRSKPRFVVDPATFGFTGIRNSVPGDRASDLTTIPNASISRTRPSRLTVSYNFLPSSLEDESRTLQFQDSVLINKGAHLLKAGLDIRRGSAVLFQVFSPNGVFAFTDVNPAGTGDALLDFLLGKPATFRQFSADNLDLFQPAYNFFVQDDWKVRRNVVLNLGLRYEYVAPLTDARDRISTFRPGARSRKFPNATEGLLFVGDQDPWTGEAVTRSTILDDKNNLAPRVGVTYSPGAKSGWLARLTGGPGKTSIRAGWGIFYEQPSTQEVAPFVGAQPFSLSLTLDGNQMAAAGGIFAAPYGSLANPFPFTGTAGTFTRGSINPSGPFLRTPYTQQYNFTVEREVAKDYRFRASYVGSKATHIKLRRQYNPGLIVAVGTQPPSPGNLISRRTFPTFNDVLLLETAGNANYNSLQLSVMKRFSRGFLFDGSYTFGKSIDDSSWLYLFSDSNIFSALTQVRYNDRRADRGLSQSDVRHRFVFSYVWELPLGRNLKGMAGKALKGWQIGGITTFQVGQPFSVLQPFDSSLIGGGDARPDVGAARYRRLDPRVPRTIGGIQGNFFYDPTGLFLEVPWEFTSVEDARARARFGNMGRNVLRGPGVNNMDFSVIKRTNFSERGVVEFRAEFFNLFNHAQFNQGFGTSTSSTFLGRVGTFTRGPRNIQLALKVKF